MKSFKTYLIAEARMTTYQEIAAAVASHKKAGEIMNQTYKDLSDQARRVFGADIRGTRDLMLKHIHAGDKSPELNAVYYDWPYDSFTSINKASKSLAKLTDPKYKDVVEAGKDVLKRWAPIAVDLKDLKGKVVKATQKRAEAKAAAEKVMSGKKADSSSLIKVLESHMKEYVAAAKKRAEEFVQQRLDTLKKHDWDLNKVAPQPSSRMSRDEYMAAKNKRDLYRSITSSKSSSLRQGEPDIRVPNQSMINRYIELNERGAEDAYRSFIEKMIQKIGKPVVAADMQGNIWTNANLTVTTNDGEQQVWSTKMIINFSKYQKMFNQFPSRRKK